MRVHLVDGTYELFRQHFGSASRHGDSGPYAAVAGVVASTLALVQDGATHIGVASDHTIESFRNDLWAGYKTSAGMDPSILIVTPDKDLGQCVRGDRVVQFDRRNREILDADGVRAKFGIGPESIADYLGLVGDTADGFPGLPGWGAKSASAVLARYGHIEDIPAAAGQWDVDGLRGAAKLSATLQAQLADALLFREIATVVTDIDVGSVDDWRWHGPTDELAVIATEIGAPELVATAERLRPST
jgi:hypothetical protein